MIFFVTFKFFRSSNKDLKNLCLKIFQTKKNLLCLSQAKTQKRSLCQDFIYKGEEDNHNQPDSM